ncbi:MAG: (2Fe-2S) ferredoxin domain-containing protein [Cyanobacteria bacterium J06600_6]
MVALQPLVSEFTVIGNLKDLSVDSKGRVRYIYLSTSDHEHAIAVSKKQPELSKQLQLGCTLKVTGMRKNKLHRDEVEYKAYQIELLEPARETTEPTAKSDRQQKAVILVCQGKSCCQRGGRTVSTQLQKEIHQAGLIGQVEIKATGCMKQCKQAPHIVMPGKKRYSRIRPEEISSIIKIICSKNAPSKLTERQL